MAVPSQSMSKRGDSSQKHLFCRQSSAAGTHFAAHPPVELKDTCGESHQGVEGRYITNFDSLILSVTFEFPLPSRLTMGLELIGIIF